jgi:hypothetical protein
MTNAATVEDLFVEAIRAQLPSDCDVRLDDGHDIITGQIAISVRRQFQFMAPFSRHMLMDAPARDYLVSTIVVRFEQSWAETTGVNALRAENERLRAALESHHDLLSDEPDDLCRTCGLAWEARPTSPPPPRDA